MAAAALGVLQVGQGLFGGLFGSPASEKRARDEERAGGNNPASDGSDDV